MVLTNNQPPHQLRLSLTNCLNLNFAISFLTTLNPLSASIALADRSFLDDWDFTFGLVHPTTFSYDLPFRFNQCRLHSRVLGSVSSFAMVGQGVPPASILPRCWSGHFQFWANQPDLLHTYFLFIWIDAMRLSARLPVSFLWTVMMFQFFFSVWIYSLFFGRPGCRPFLLSYSSIWCLSWTVYMLALWVCRS